MPLTKEEQAQLDALTAKANEPPDRREEIHVRHTYDPDDESSVAKGYERGHLTDADLEGWGWKDLLAKLKAVSGGDDDDNDDGKGGKGGGGEPPKRKGYFGS